jgi:hypothetical protein
MARPPLTQLNGPDFQLGMLMKFKISDQMLKKSALLVSVAALSLSMSCVNAQSTGSTGSSEQVTLGTASILVSPVASVAGSVADGNPLHGSELAVVGSSFVVAGIVQGTKDSVEIILDAASGSGKVSVKLAKSAFEKAGVSMGTAVQAVAESTGTLLIASGKVLAFIPNAVGEALLYNSRVAGASTP